jgi:alkylhydroperoxidase/carboxymuconolactone decarboxylase family protein YurZ
LTTSLSLPIICDARCVEEQSENDRWQRGLEAYASQFGIEKSEVPQWFAERFGERFGREAITAAGGAWPDDALSLRDRSLVVVASLVTQGGVESRLRGHVRWAVELEALVTLLGVYVGFPKASAGMEIVRDELDQLGL